MGRRLTTDTDSLSQMRIGVALVSREGLKSENETFDKICRCGNKTVNVQEVLLVK